MRKERDIQAGTCHNLVARVAKGESKGARRYDKENLLWQSTLSVNPVGSAFVTACGPWCCKEKK